MSPPRRLFMFPRFCDRRQTVVLGLAVFLVAFALRTWALSVPLNLDEVAWLRRGAAFAREILANDLDSTYGRHHPGVTNMWLTGWGMTVNCVLQPQFPQWFQLSQPFPDLETCLRFEDYRIPWFLLPRLVHAAVTAALTSVTFVLLRRLFGVGVGLTAIALLLVEPFFLGYQRFLTTDALSLDFAVLSLLWLLLYLRLPLPESRSALPPPRRGLFWLLASGVAMGLAAASKITVLFLLPGVGLWIVCIERGWWRGVSRRGLGQWLADVLLWSSVFLTTIYLLWPLLWVEPGDTLVKLYEELVEESARGNFFFLGETTDEVGLLFYPLVLLYRSSPLLLGGAGVALAMLLRRRWRAKLPHVPELTALLLAAGSLLLVFSVFSNKLDRYPLPVFPVLAVLAAVGWQAIARHLLGKRAPLALAALLTVQTLALLPYVPNYVTYYNPLLGGNRAALGLFQLGQGEGLDRAARWLTEQLKAEAELNAESDLETVRAASWYESVFRAYFPGEVLELGRSPDNGEAPDWTLAQYLVLYVNQVQREFPSPEMLAYFRDRPPLHVVRQQGIDYAWVYPGLVPRQRDLAQIVPVADAERPVATLLGTDPFPTVFAPGTRLDLATYWRFQDSPPAELSLRLTVGDRRQTQPLLGGFLFPAQIPPGSIRRHQQAIALPQQPGTYPLQATLMQNGQPLGSPVDMAVVTVEALSP